MILTEKSKTTVFGRLGVKNEKDLVDRSYGRESAESIERFANRQKERMRELVLP